MIGNPNYGSVPRIIVVIDPNTGLPITSFSGLVGGAAFSGGKLLLEDGISFLLFEDGASKLLSEA